MLSISQKDHNWASVKIGKSRTSIGVDGCTICALCMISSKFLKDPYLPQNAAHHWVFDRTGRIIWTRTKFRGMEFIWRGYKNDFDQIKKYANDANKAVIVQVNNNHWLAVSGVAGTRIGINDPWDGKEYLKLPSKYKITGYALFKKTNDVPEWAEEDCSLAIAAGLPSDNLNAPVGVVEMQEDLEKLSKIDRVAEMPRYRWYTILRKTEIL